MQKSNQQPDEETVEQSTEEITFEDIESSSSQEPGISGQTAGKSPDESTPSEPSAQPSRDISDHKDTDTTSPASEPTDEKDQKTDIPESKKPSESPSDKPPDKPEEPKEKKPDTTTPHIPPTDTKPKPPPSGEPAKKASDEAKKQAAAKAAEEAGKVAVETGKKAGEKVAKEAAKETFADALSIIFAETGIIPAILQAWRRAENVWDILQLIYYIFKKLWGCFLIAGLILAAIALGVIFSFYNWQAMWGSEGSQESPGNELNAMYENAITSPTGLPPLTLTNDNQQTPEQTTFIYIEQAQEDILSNDYKTFIQSQIKPLNDEIVRLYTEEYSGVNNSADNLNLLQKNNEILNALSSYHNLATDNDEQIYQNHLINHYLNQDSKLINLAYFNAEIFEYLLIQTGQGGQIAGNIADDQTLRQSRRENLPKLMEYVSSKQIDYINRSGQDESSKQTKIDKIQNRVDRMLSTLEIETTERDPSWPYALEFADENELRLLLPLNIQEYKEYKYTNGQINRNIYYILSYIFRTLQKTGEDFEIYQHSNFIQDPSTPGNILQMCQENLEDNPEYCGQSPTNFCGIGQILFYTSILSNNVNNLGVPYKDRSHIKIWLGLDAPLNSDEAAVSDNQPGSNITYRNTHYDFDAMDIIEFGLYNERLDCTSCQGLSVCSGECNLTHCCPTELDSAKDEYVPVQVQWQHLDTPFDNTDITSIISPYTNSNVFNILSSIAEILISPLEQLLNIDIVTGNFDIFQLINGNYTTLMSFAGNQLINNIYQQLGLPLQFNPNILLSNNHNIISTAIGSDYLNQVFNLTNHSFTPLMSSLLPSEYKSDMLDLINQYPHLSLSPSLHQNLLSAINSENHNLASKISLANIGLQELTHQIFGLTDYSIDTNDISSLTGFASITNRQSDITFSQILGLPTNYISNTDKQFNLLLSKSTAIITDSIGNIYPNSIINEALNNNQSPGLNQLLSSFKQQDFAKLFASPNNHGQEIYDYINNPDNSSGHTSFVSNFENKIDSDKIISNYPNLNNYALNLIIEQGTSPSLGDQYTLSSIYPQIVLERIGTNISHDDAKKIPYLVEYLDLEKSLGQDTTTELVFPTTHPELLAYDQKFRNSTGSTESINQFRQRIIELIENAARYNEISSYYLYTVKPLKIKFSQTSDLFNFSNDYTQNNHSNNYHYFDRTFLVSANQTNPNTVNNVLGAVQIDINSLEFIPESNFENNQNSDAKATLQSNQTYYAFPSIDLPEIIFPGIRPNYQYHNNIGPFETLQAFTNSAEQSLANPIELTVYTNSNLPFIPPQSFQPDQDSLLTAMENKFTTDPTHDTLSPYGGTEYIFHTLNQIGSNQDELYNNLSRLGALSLAWRMNGINPIALDNTTFNEPLVHNIINTFGLIESWPNNSLIDGIHNATSFSQTHDVFQTITAQNPNININNIQEIIFNGNFFNSFENIPSILNNFDQYAPQIGNITSSEFFNLIKPQTNTPDKIFSISKNIMSSNISNNSSVDYDLINNELNQTLTLNSNNLIQLITNQTIQNNVLQNFNPQYLNEIGSVFDNILHNNTNLNQGLAQIATSNTLQNISSFDQVNNFYSQFGGLSNAALNTNIQDIIPAINQEFSNSIANWLNQNHLDNIFGQNLSTLFNPNISNFILDSTSNSINNFLLSNLPSDLQNQLSNLFNSLNFGTLDYSQYINTIIPNLQSIINANPKLGLNNIAQSINFPNQLQLNNISLGIPLDNKFSKCKQTIAKDNITHLTDILASFYLNKRIQDYYNISSDKWGELLSSDQNNASLILAQLSPHQIFSEFTDDVFEKIAVKTNRIFDYLWPKDREKSSINLNNDVWRNDCQDRDNPYMQSCKEYVHINF
ncbi:hypothetical protein KJ855_04315 [Patescibacteria group bacterium]|nr:hypothetical protein [Patescibacteria group bacterium]